MIYGVKNAAEATGTLKDIVEDEADTPERPRKRLRMASNHPIATKVFTSTTLFLRSIRDRRESMLPVLSTGCKPSSNSYQYTQAPPAARDLVATIESHKLPSKIYQDPYYSVESDASDHPWEFAGLSYHIKGGTGVGVLEEWNVMSAPSVDASFAKPIPHEACLWGWEYASSPPSVQEVRRWWKEEGQLLGGKATKKKKSSQVRTTFITSFGITR